MRREADRESHDRERRVRGAGRREHRASRHEQVGDAMDSAIAIDHPAVGIAVHAGRSDVMTRSAHGHWPGIGLSAHRASERSDATPRKVLAEYGVRAVRRGFVE